MRMKLLILILLLIPGVFQVKSQNLVIREMDGTEIVNVLSSLQSFTVNSSSLLMKHTSGVTDTYSLSDIRKLYFTGTTGVETDDDGETISIYPNPTSNSLYIKNLPKGTSMVAIYRIDGALVLQKQVSSDGEPIDVSGLQNGLYLFKANVQTLKFVKL